MEVEAKVRFRMLLLQLSTIKSISRLDIPSISQKQSFGILFVQIFFLGR